MIDLLPQHNPIYYNGQYSVALELQIVAQGAFKLELRSMGQLFAKCKLRSRKVPVNEA